MNLKIISAGAGSGKTYSLTQEMTRLLMPQDNGAPAEVRAAGILATTFTNKAAAELQERVRVKLLEEGLSKEADELGSAMIGTVHAIGVQLLKRFAFEAGVSPDVDIIADDDQQTIFNQSLATILSEERTQLMESLALKLGFKKNSAFSKDWRQDLRKITDIARANNMSLEVLEQSKDHSLSSFFGLLPEPSNKTAQAFKERLQFLIKHSIQEVENTEDGTKAKQTLLQKLRGFQKALRLRDQLFWYEWLGIAKACEKAPKKCRDAVQELKEFTLTHDCHPDFHNDLNLYISMTFELAIEALKEYENYKKSRGLIDYTDMEVMILKLLENQLVLEVLSDELDLLLVDEFQDTNPIQLKIFLKLTKIAKQSIWVGDPKQSIYGFRGAAPELMQAVMDSTEKIDVLKYSWRSRQDLVYMSNGLFCEAFQQMPDERIALEVADKFRKEEEATGLGTATHHWIFDYTEGNKIPGKPWMEKALSKAISALLEEDWKVRVKGSNEIRSLQAKDIAILCRTNSSCQEIAAQLSQQGIKASISRAGLLETAEASLIQACLKFILNEYDSLSVAEIMLLMEDQAIESIIEHRLDYLNKEKDNNKQELWGKDNPNIQLLTKLRETVQELSITEILSLVIEKLDIRRVAAAWGNAQQRFDNIDVLRSMALQYEENCIRLHNAATLGGFLLWLEESARAGKDEQGAGTDADAVNVLTYHKSKGLEWPVVICYDMGKKLRENVFDVRIVATHQSVNLDDPLAGRLLCFWVNPYGDLVNKTALMEAIDIHPERQKIKQAALDEEARLLYVGFTRARDYLVLPIVPKHRSGNNNTDWMNRVFHHGNEQIPSVDPLADQCLWTWKEHEIPVQKTIFEFEKEIEMDGTAEESAFYYLPPYKGEKIYASAQPENAEDLLNNLWAKQKPPLSYYPPLALIEQGEIDINALVQLLQRFIRSDRLNYGMSKREKAANYLIEQFKLEHCLNSVELMNISSRYYKQLESLFGISTLQTGLFFRYRHADRSFKGKLDYLLTKDNGDQVLISDVPLAYEDFRRRQQKKLMELAASLYAASEHLKKETADSNDRKYQYALHFPLEGKLVLLELGTHQDSSIEVGDNNQGLLF